MNSSKSSTMSFLPSLFHNIYCCRSSNLLPTVIRHSSSMSGDPMMNPSQSSMSEIPSLCEQYSFLVDTESVSHSGMLVNFDIEGSPDEYL